MKKVIFFILITYHFFPCYSQIREKDIFDFKTVQLSPLGINTNSSEFGPAIIDQTLLFTSSAQDKSPIPDSKKNKEFYHLFMSGIDAFGNLSGEKKFNEFSSSFHNGPVSWCPVTYELYITQSYDDAQAEFRPFRKNFHQLRIVSARKNNGKWEKAEEFPFNNPRYSVGHPAISFSGDTMVFCSNKPGGVGKTDLYMTIRKDGKWSDPVNLGKSLNTVENDEFPFITPNGYLIFSSDGRGGLGGLDVYYTRLKFPIKEIRHFENPINSKYDDFSMTLSFDHNFGFVASNRPGKGEDDIYKFTFDQFKPNFLELTVYDSKSHRPIPNAEIEFDDKTSFITGNNGEVLKMIEDNKSFDLNVKAFGYTQRNKNLHFGELQSGQLIRDSILMNMALKQKIILRNIYYDFNSAELLPESFPSLDIISSFLIENQNIHVNIGSHTDSRGTAKYNLELSKRRANSVVGYILTKGIDGDRLVATGYGESIPVNHCTDSVECTPDEYRMNRRTEFYIEGVGKSETVQQTGKGDYTPGFYPEDLLTAKESPSIKKRSSDPVRKETDPNQKKNSHLMGENQKAIEPESHNNSQKRSVVIGSFLQITNAKRNYELLTQENFNTEIIKIEKFYSVRVRFQDLSSAKEGLAKLREKYPDAIIQ